MSGLIDKQQRESWRSKLGFILATSGAAIGLGNIQRFPYSVAENGGGAFLCVYLLCILLLGLPLVLVEFSIGRATQKNPVAALKHLTSANSKWKYVGILGVCTAFFILSYYLVVAGWTLYYTWKSFVPSQLRLEAITNCPVNSLVHIFVFQMLTIFIVLKGITKGIEKTSKVLLPLLFILLCVLSIRSLSLPGSWQGVEFYLRPDFSKINIHVVLAALSQAFFSLSIGEAVLVTFASYVPKTDNLISSAAYMTLFDTFVAFCSGFIIFPALFALGLSPDQGVGLVFQVMPKIFAAMPAGQYFAPLFFLLLAFAALTTCIALLEIPVTYLTESFKVSRPKAVWSLGLLALFISVPIALSHGAVESLSKLEFAGQKGLYHIFDFVWGGLAMVFGGLMLVIFVGWVWGVQNATTELTSGCPRFVIYKKLWEPLIRYFIPPFIILILVGMFMA